MCINHMLYFQLTLNHFICGAPTLLKKRDRVLAKVKSKYWQRTHKYGIWIPKSVEEASAIDKSAFEKWEKREGDLPPGYQIAERKFT